MDALSTNHSTLHPRTTTALLVARTTNGCEETTVASVSNRRASRLGGIGGSCLVIVIALHQPNHARSTCENRGWGVLADSFIRPHKPDRLCCDCTRYRWHEPRSYMAIPYWSSKACASGDNHQMERTGWRSDPATQESSSWGTKSRASAREGASPDNNKMAPRPPPSTRDPQVAAQYVDEWDAMWKDRSAPR